MYWWLGRGGKVSGGKVSGREFGREGVGAGRCRGGKVSGQGGPSTVCSARVTMARRKPATRCAASPGKASCSSWRSSTPEKVVHSRRCIPPGSTIEQFRGGLLGGRPGTDEHG